jgi:UMF1 family MFS transporter
MAAERPAPFRAVAAWVVYDVANAVFSMGVVSLYFSLYVRDQVGAASADRVYGLITTISMGLIFVVSPLLGAMTDRARKRMPFLVWSALVCAGATALLARGPYALSALLFILANAAYQAGVQFYDALLPDVTTEDNRGRIGGVGVGVGYLGSYIAVGLGFLIPADHKATLFLVIAIAFLAFALPCFFLVPEQGNPRPRPVFGWAVIRESTAETVRTLRAGHRYPGLLRFLVGRIFYTDAINTVISFMSLYTVNVAVATGLSSEAGEVRSRLVLMAAVTCAVVGGFVWGVLVDRIGPKRTLNLVLALWVVTFVLAASVGAFRLSIVFLYVVACLAGIALGGTWAADRPYMLRLTPPDRVGEFYGLYGMVGRFSAVCGPLVWSATTYWAVERSGLAPLTGQAIAILTLLLMILLSAWILAPVTDERRDWAALAEPLGSPRG